MNRNHLTGFFKIQLARLKEISAYQSCSALLFFAYCFVYLSSLIIKLLKGYISTHTNEIFTIDGKLRLPITYQQIIFCKQICKKRIWYNKGIKDTIQNDVNHEHSPFYKKLCTKEFFTSIYSHIITVTKTQTLFILIS